MEFAVETADRLTTVSITERVREALENTPVNNGIATVFVEHTTAALLVQEDEPRLRGDLESFISGLVPDEGHAHDELDGNADSHLRAALFGPSVTVPLVDGELALGRWQSIFLLECDGPRTRRVSVRVVGA